MASLLFQIKVKEYSAWRKVYDTLKGFRISMGQLSEQVYRDADDPHKVAILFTWDAIENAQKYTRAPELRAAMADAGVEGPPSITFLNEA